MVLHAAHLCSGYGGFELALGLAGVDCRTVVHVERDAYAAAVLVARMEDATLDRAPVWSDVATFDGTGFRGRVDLVTAGFPCQPWSAAGKRGGLDDDRWLWPHIARVLGEVRPWLVFLENVPGLNRGRDGGGLSHVLADLADLGFDAQWGLLSAAAVGATHRRERFWLLAVAHDDIDRLQAVWRESEHDRHPRHDVDRPGGADVADPDEHRGRRDRDTVRQPIWRAKAAMSGEDVGDAEVSGPEGLDRLAVGGRASLTGPSPTGQDVADAAGERVGAGVRPDSRPQGWVAGAETRRGAMVWPPGPDDTDGWERWSAEGGPEPSVRRGADGRPAGLADALHLGGNGLVPRVAAAAFVELAGRLIDDSP